MAKISALPAIAPPSINGEELVPVVKGGITGRASLNALAQPWIAAMDSAAAAQNWFASLAAGEAGTEEGEFFSHPDGEGGLVYRSRTAGGSTIIGYAATRSQVEDRLMRLSSFATAPLKSVPGGTATVWIEDRAAWFVSDALADDDLLADHPDCTFESANGRKFRLAADSAAVITPEQLGCPRYAPGVNARPFIAAAIKYAEAISEAGFKAAVQHTQSKYEIWPPLRTPSPDGSATQPIPRGEITNTGGVPFLIHRRVEMVAAPGGTEYIRKTNDGSDPAVFANWPVLADNYGYGSFRGGMFAYIPRADAPADPTDEVEMDGYASLVLRGNWVFDGGLGRTNDPGLHSDGGSEYRLGTDGKGWDIYDKILWVWTANGEGYVGKLLEVHGDVVFKRFADLSLFGVSTHNALHVRGRLRIEDSDAGGYDLGMYNAYPGARLDADKLQAVGCYLGMERTGGWKNRIGELWIEECTITGSTFGGDYGDADDDAGLPDYQIGRLVLIHNGTVASGRHIFHLFKNVQVDEVVATDCCVNIGSSASTPSTFTDGNVTIGRVRALADRLTGYSAVSFSSQDATPGSYKTNNCYVGQVICGRTALARAAGRYIGYPVTWNNASFGANCTVGQVMGDAQFVSKCSSDGTVADYNIGILRDQASYNTGGDFWNGETTPALGGGRAGYELLGSTANAMTSLTLPPIGKYPTGSRIIVRNRDSNKYFSIGATAGSKRMIIPPSFAIEFEVKTGAWWPRSDTRLTLNGTLTTDVASIPAASQSADITITVNGAQVGMNVNITCDTAAVMQNCVVQHARVSAANTVTFRLYNVSTGAAYDPPNANYRATCEYNA